MIPQSKAPQASQASQASQAPQAPAGAAQVEFERKRALLAKVKELRGTLLQNKGKVYPKDPAAALPADKDYVWVNRHENRIVHFKSLGYTICTDPKVMTDWRTEDGTHRYGDLVLMEISKELREMLKLEAEIRAIEAVDGEQSFATFANRVGIRVSTPNS